MPLWIWIIVGISMAWLFCWYISPSRNKSPTKAQKVVSIIWIVLRRIISFIAAAFGMLCIYILLTSSGSTIEKTLGSIMIFGLSLFFVYVGVIGQGWNQYGITDDLTLYTKIKNKYGIRW